MNYYQRVCFHHTPSRVIASEFHPLAPCAEQHKAIGEYPEMDPDGLDDVETPRTFIAVWCVVIAVGEWHHILIAGPCAPLRFFLVWDHVMPQVFLIQARAAVVSLVIL